MWVGWQVYVFVYVYMYVDAHAHAYVYHLAQGIEVVLRAKDIVRLCSTLYAAKCLLTALGRDRGDGSRTGGRGLRSRPLGVRHGP